MWHSINWDKLIVWLLPTYLRKTRIYALVLACIDPLKTSYDGGEGWVSFREDNIYRLQHNGQTCYLRKALNDKFYEYPPVEQRRKIKIKNGLAKLPNYAYSVLENKPLFLQKDPQLQDVPIYLYGSEDSAENGVDFIVTVPKIIKDTKEQELIAEINHYRQAGKRFKIETYESI